ncbi:hypothetical protein BDZ45DRAFT_724458 [Acephala macrosclerotiorum]|nr:hypothetical protein BDZ45DRAFT_724458 [Acephala macrosclerotiorum]
MKGESQQSTKGESQQPTKGAIATLQDQLIDRRLDRQRALLNRKEALLDRQEALLNRQEALLQDTFQLNNRRQQGQALPMQALMQAPMQAPVQALAQDRQYQGYLSPYLQQSVSAYLNYSKW